MRYLVECSECRNAYVATDENQRCPFCVGAPGEVILALEEIGQAEVLTEVPTEVPTEAPAEIAAAEAPAPPASEEKPRAQRKRGKE